MTQQKFADKLGLKRQTIATYETGRNEPMDNIIKSICREFNVNEEWLRYGTGEMYKLVEDEVSAAASEITDSDNSIMKDLMVVYNSLSPASQAALEELAEGMYIRMKERKEKGEQS